MTRCFLCLPSTCAGNDLSSQLLRTETSLQHCHFNLQTLYHQKSLAWFFFWNDGKLIEVVYLRGKFLDF